MRKRSVYLDELDASRLAAVARLAGSSRADAIRRAIRQYVAGDRAFALSNSGEGPGGSIAGIPNDMLADFGADTAVTAGHDRQHSVVADHDRQHSVIADHDRRIVDWSRRSATWADNPGDHEQ